MKIRVRQFKHGSSGECIDKGLHDLRIRHIVLGAFRTIGCTSEVNKRQENVMVVRIGSREFEVTEAKFKNPTVILPSDVDVSSFRISEPAPMPATARPGLCLACGEIYTLGIGDAFKAPVFDLKGTPRPFNKNGCRLYYAAAKVRNGRALENVEVLVSATREERAEHNARVLLKKRGHDIHKIVVLGSINPDLVNEGARRFIEAMAAKEAE